MQTRREFLAAAGAAMAAPRRVLVAGHPYVYTQHRPDRDLNAVLDQVFADMRYAGLDAIELMHTALQPDGAVERIRTLSRRHRLPVLGMSYSAEMWDREKHAAILEESARLVGRLADVGGRTLGISVGTPGKPKTSAQLDAQADLLRKLIKICDGNGVVPNLHNHTYEVSAGEYDLNGTLERIPGIRLGPDFSWLRRADVDPVDFIRRRGKAIVFAHLRDEQADGKRVTAMGDGVMDYAAIGEALRQAGFAGDLAIELAHAPGAGLSEPLKQSLKRSREYVRRTMKY